MLWVRGGLAGFAAEVLCVHVDVWVALGGLGCAGRCRLAPWVRDGPCGVVGLVVGGSCGGWPSGVLWWFPGGLRTAMGGMGGARSRFADFFVMQGMLVDERQHVFPRGGVGELLRVCQQEVFAVYHLGPCPADCF